MKRFKEYFVLLLCMAMLAAAFSGCTKEQESTPEQEELHIYASFYPIYAIAEALMQGIPNAQLHCLVQPQDGCLRDYQLSDWDLSLLEKSADMVIIGGRGLESFENALYSLGENGPVISAVLYNRELLSGMMEDQEGSEENHWQDANPHLYMDAEGAILIAEGISAQLSTADPGNGDIYMENLEVAENRLRSVIEDIKEKTALFSGEKIILMNETAAYIADACGFEVEKCIARDSGEAYYDYELDKCIAELKECESEVILIEKQAPERFCEALEDAGFVLAKIDTMSSGRAEEGFEGYLEALTGNAEAVAAAFEGSK